MSKIQINNGEREILEALWREGKPMIVSDVAKIIGASDVTLHVNMKKLMKKGLVVGRGVNSARDNFIEKTKALFKYLNKAFVFRSV